MRVLLADLIVVAHLAYVLFVVVGLGLILVGWWRGWAWVRSPLFRLAHLAAIALVAAEAVAGVTCPLTIWEYDLRVAAGQAPEEIGFVARIARDVLFFDVPEEAFRPWYVGFLGLVVLTLFCVRPTRRWKESRAGG
ncbi:DUF2784 domain-containing protein [Engelhardtia mirabilis]|uniref:DUF2784 domain-containing protein n=1 Tax=Engelhardtia mirabilis TaxID=2528011 RepID=A0A518BFC6_9BACT|nr:hypothetical protein Pla133_07490 [Planctomycetes bacterium Pla133]QDV00010.1 hypothetical protein Pla86_07480 [Planctomycetes bacterium Pla86]